VTSTSQATRSVVDPARWPDVARVPRSVPRAAIARVLFTAAVARLSLRVELPDGRTLGAGSVTSPVMVLHDPAAFYARLGASGLIGVGESYLAGEWECADLTALLTVFAAHIADLVPPALQPLRRIAVRRQPPGDEPTRDGARRNIERHYDLSNDFFALFLDETMTYSSALFAGEPDEQGSPGDSGDLLARAQRRKIDRLLDEADVGPDCRLLEIGTGWGELAIRAAQRGATVRTITVSRQQAELASRRVAEAGLADRVSVELRDYRDASGRFDAVCSCEMIEAVGGRYWSTYFTTLERVLVPGGRVALQVITMPHDRMLASRRTYTWINKYIFPGGQIPSLAAIEQSLAHCTRLYVTDRLDFGEDYARTLALWRERFCARPEEVANLGFDEVFSRMWLFYLCYAEAGFRSGYLGVSQLRLERR
jgi:cyclopropane-fatty-acyl-phospholipid synthase